MDTEISKEGIIWAAQEVSWGSGAGISHTEGKHGDRRAFHAGPCAYVDLNSTEVFGIPSDRVYEGEKRDSDSKDIYGAQEEGTLVVVVSIRFERFMVISSLRLCRRLRL
jgi:hypothetical protein